MTNNPSNDIDDDELFWKLEDFDLPAKDEPKAANNTEKVGQPVTKPLDSQSVAQVREVKEDISPAIVSPSLTTAFPELGDFPENSSDSSSNNLDSSDELGNIDDAAPLLVNEPSESEVPLIESTEDRSSIAGNIKSNNTLGAANQQQLTSWQSKDKIALVVFATLLLSAVSIFVAYFANNTNFTDQYSWKQTLPADGKLVKVESVDTYWQKAKGPDVKLGVEYIPVIKIAISDESSDSALRIAFKNYDGKSVGDPKIELIKGGKFDNGKTEKNIYCTDGLLDEANLRGYLAQNEVRWTVHLTESATTRSSITEENKVGSNIISPNFIEN